MPPKRPASPEATSSDVSSKVYISESIHDRNSVFIGYYNPSTSEKPKALQQRSDVASASHRVLAWRLPSSQRTLLPGAQPVYKSDHDDDGEQWAGRKVKDLMEELGLSGSIMVARWYGGELLGPVRFKHIVDVARGAVDAWRSEKDSAGPKRPKLNAVPGSSETMSPEELARRKKEIIETLQRRDESIATLRALLEQKKSISSPSKPQQPLSSPARLMKYSDMPLMRLRGLENARDSTINFLLISIDKAEAEAAQRAEEAKKAAESAAALKAAQEADELDDAWAEMAEAMEKHKESENKT